MAITTTDIRMVAQLLGHRGRCPNCGYAGKIRTRIRTKDRVCERCGYIGPPQDFQWRGIAVRTV